MPWVPQIYPNACHDAFRRHPGLAYPSELARREDGLKDTVLSAGSTIKKEEEEEGRRHLLDFAGIYPGT